MSHGMIGSVINPSYYDAGPYAFTAPTNPEGYIGAQYQEYLAGTRSFDTPEVLAFCVASYALGLYPDTAAGWQRFMEECWNQGGVELARAGQWDLVELRYFGMEESAARRGSYVRFARFGEREDNGEFFYHWQYMGGGDPEGVNVDWHANPFGYWTFNRFGTLAPVHWEQGGPVRYLVAGELVFTINGPPGIYAIGPEGLSGPLAGTESVDWYRGIGRDVLQQVRESTSPPVVPDSYYTGRGGGGNSGGGKPNPGGLPGSGGTDGTGYGDLAQGRRRVPLVVMGGAGVLYDFDHHTDDHGEPIRVALQYDPLVPAGAGGEALFTTAYLTVTSSMAVTLTVTPVLDGVAREAEAQEVAVPGGERRETHHYEIPLYVQHAFGRSGLRGTRLSLRIEGVGLSEGDLIVDSTEIEHETVRESKRPQGAA